MPATVNENYQVSPFFALFIVFAVQVGIGILGYERIISKSPGYDAWISVLVMGVLTHIPLWMIFRMLERGKGDLINIHRDLFGKWIGGFLTILFLLYLMMMGITVLSSYVELVHVWMFPHMSYWVLAGLIAILAYTVISGGFRTVTGICFLSVIYGTPLFFALYAPLGFAHYSNFLPMLNHPPSAILISMKQMSLNYLGLCVFLICYPFLKQPKQAKRWAHYGLMLTTFTYLVVIFVSTAYYSQPELKHVIWPTITLWKVVNLPFLDRFEYVGITIWLFVILPNLCLVIWGASRGFKRLFHFRQRIVIIILIIAIYFIGNFFITRTRVQQLDVSQSDIGLYFLYLYIPFIFIYQTILHKVRKHHGHS